MYVGLFDLFKIGIGPSSSHTMGPMLAAQKFLSLIDPMHVASVAVDLYGSLSATGRGHKADEAVIFGLAGFSADTVTAEEIHKALLLAEKGQLLLASKNRISFQRESDIRFTDETLDEHPNALRFTAYDSRGEAINSELYFSVGDGFVQTVTELMEAPQTSMPEEPYPFESFKDLLAFCLSEGLSISRVMIEN